MQEWHAGENENAVSADDVARRNRRALWYVMIDMVLVKIEM